MKGSCVRNERKKHNSCMLEEDRQVLNRVGNVFNANDFG